MSGLSPGVYDVVVAGSGPGGSVVASRLRAQGRKVLLLEEGERPRPAALRAPADLLLRRFYRNAGAIPFFGPFAFSFGEGKVPGGGSFVNAGLVLEAPERLLQSWREKMPGSIFEAPGWRAAEARVAAELRVNTDHDLTGGANADSLLLHGAAAALGWRSGPVPRAVVNCRSHNRCATGCTSGAKRSAAEAFLAPFESAGGEFIDGAKALRVVPPRGTAAGELSYLKAGVVRRAAFRNAVLCAGATQSALLLRKSGLSAQAGRRFEFHLNFKVIARFPFELNADRGTLLTHQVREFEDEGILIMPSCVSPEYLSLELSRLDGPAAAALAAAPANVGLFAAMVRPRAGAALHSFLDQTYGFWSWDRASELLARKALLKTCELLFKAGAEELVLPLRKAAPVCTQAEAAALLASAPASDLGAVSVHGMSANRMGADAECSVVDLDARVRGQENIFVADSSILPTNTGRSPQGMVMAAAHLLADRWERAGLL